MASCNSWQYLVTILAKIFPRSWQDLAEILLRYPRRVDAGVYKNQYQGTLLGLPKVQRVKFHLTVTGVL